MGFTGGCLCGGVRYECSADPAGIVYCHCRNCQIASGGAFSSNVMVPPDSVTITSGELTTYQDTGESGNTVSREFCGACGSALLSRPEGALVVKAGSLDDPSGLQAMMSIWEDSAQGWALKSEGVPTFAKNPG